MCYLSKVQGDVDLVELQPPGKRGALPPALCPIDGICDGVGFVAVCRGADVTVLALAESTKTTFNSGQKNVVQSSQVSQQFRKYSFFKFRKYSLLVLIKIQKVLFAPI